MNRFFYPLTCALLLGLVAGCAKQPAKSLEGDLQTDVTRIIRTLAADDLRGRRTFSPEIDKAADFIAQEFETIGLAKMPGQTTFFQEFVGTQFKIVASSLTMNGEVVAPENFFCLAEQAQVALSLANAKFFVLAKGDNFRNKLGYFQQTASTDKVNVILVHPDQKANFSRYRGFMTNEPPVKLTPEKSPAFVYVLAEAEPTALAGAATFTKIELKMKNVVGYLPGKSRKAELVIFGAHYDHIGILKSVNGDSIANGADDDASGTTAVLALAKHFKQQGTNERSLIFVTFTGEELGMYGSQYFSKQQDPDKVVAMFNIEMVGKPSKFGPGAAFITGYERSDFGKILQKNLQGTDFVFHPDPYPDLRLFYRSDNATLARQGVPAHTISSDEIDKDKLYHSVDDEVESLDLANLARIIKAIAKSAESIVAGQDTPTRVSMGKGE